MLTDIYQYTLAYSCAISYIILMVSKTRLTLLAALLFLTACEEPTKSKPDISLPISLSSKIVGSTSARLQLTVEDDGKEHLYRLARDGAIQSEGSFTGGDTALIVDGIIPATNYTYRAYSLHEGIVADSSDALVVVTRETTSHDFTWELDTLAHEGYARGIYALAPDDVWVVGDFTIFLPSGPSSEGLPQMRYFNCAHWNGHVWEEIYIEPVESYRDDFVSDVIAFDDNDVWVAKEGIAHFDGSNWSGWRMDDIPPNKTGYLRKVWGSSSSNLFFGSDFGSLVHYDGSTFTEVQMLGIVEHIYDITGNSKGVAWIIPMSMEPPGVSLYRYEDEILIVVDSYEDPYYPFQDSSGRDYTNTYTIFSVKDEYIVRPVSTVYSQAIAIHSMADFDDYLWITSPDLPSVANGDGNDINDLFFISSGTVLHYNGATFSSSIPVAESMSFVLYQVDQIGDHVFVRGRTNRERPIILRGTRL